MLALLLTLFSFNPNQQKDSTLLYTLKDNEVLVQMNEHKLTMSIYGSSYIFCVNRKGVGYFVYSNKTPYGPFLDSKATSSFFYWRVRKADGVYYLHAPSGKMTGPFPETISENDISFDPFFVGRVAMPNRSININGKIYKTAHTSKDSSELSIYTTEYVNDNIAKVKFILESANGEESIEDSVMIAGPPVPAASLKVEARHSEDDIDSLFVDGKFRTVANTVEGYLNGKSYHVSTDGSLYYTRQDKGGTTPVTSVYKGDKLIFKSNSFRDVWDLYVLRTVPSVFCFYASDGIYYVSVDGKYLDETPPAFDGLQYKYIVWRKKQQWASMKDGEIYLSNGKKYSGADLDYNAADNAFHWISVHGRSIYLNKAYCE